MEHQQEIFDAALKELESYSSSEIVVPKPAAIRDLYATAFAQPGFADWMAGRR